MLDTEKLHNFTGSRVAFKNLQISNVAFLQSSLLLPSSFALSPGAQLSFQNVTFTTTCDNIIFMRNALGIQQVMGNRPAFSQSCSHKLHVQFVFKMHGNSLIKSVPVLQLCLCRPCLRTACTSSIGPQLK
jgi:hypothetical protein